MLTEEGIALNKKRRNNRCASHNFLPIPSSARAAGNFSHWEKEATQ